MNSGISEEAKRAIANGTRRRAADRLDRDGCHSMDAVRRRVRALPQGKEPAAGRLCQADAADDQGGEGRTA
jgi:hypothetical protein